MQTGIIYFGKIESPDSEKLKPAIQDVYAHARILHVALYGRIIMKIFDAETIIIILLILNFSHFNIYIFARKITTIRIYKEILPPQ